MNQISQGSSSKGSYNFTLFLYDSISFLLVFVLFDYVKPSPEEPVSYLSYFIYLIGIIGLLLFYIYYSRLKKELSCALLTYNEADNFLIDVKTNGLEYQLHQFKELGTKDEDLTVNRIISHIHTEAESKKFESGLTILGAYKDEFASKTMRLFGFQKVALQLGILGTFIGLAMAFKDISGSSIDDKAVDHLLRSLKIPFSASIAGLQVAFIMWLHIDYLQKKQEVLFKTMEKCVDGLVNLARHAIYKDSITVELQHVSLRMDELAGKIEKSNELLYSQNGQISEGIGRLKSANSDLDMFLYGIANKQQEFLTTVKSLYDSLSPDLISKELKHSLSNGAQEISGVMSKHLNDTLDRYSEVEQSMVTMNDHFRELQVYLESQAKQGEENISRHKQEIFESFNQMMTMQKQYMEQLSKTDMREQIKEVLNSAASNITRELKSDFEKLVPQISSLVNEMTVFNNYTTRKLSWKKKWRKWLNIFWSKRNIQVEKT